MGNRVRKLTYNIYHVYQDPTGVGETYFQQTAVLTIKGYN